MANPICQALFQYHSCNCRTLNPVYICGNPKCNHPAPSLNITAIPIACSSKSTSQRGWQSANIRGRVIRTPACTARDPAVMRFTREEDTAVRLDMVKLNGCQGLCGETLDQVVPLFVKGDWREQVRARYEEFRKPTMLPVKNIVGVIGDRKPVSPPPATRSVETHVGGLVDKVAKTAPEMPADKHVIVLKPIRQLVKASDPEPQGQKSPSPIRKLLETSDPEPRQHRTDSSTPTTDDMHEGLAPVKSKESWQIKKELSKAINSGAPDEVVIRLAAQINYQPDWLVKLKLRCQPCTQ
jgi:hypothetical protein